MEYRPGRGRAARKIRARLSSWFPEIDGRYDLILGGFPEAIAGTGWAGDDVVFLFTNVAAEWDEDRTARAIASFRSAGEVILDLRLFGTTRDEESERRALFDRIAATAVTAERLPDLTESAHYARFTFETRASSRT